MSLTKYDMVTFTIVKLMALVVQWFTHQSLSGLFKAIEFLCSPTETTQTKLSSACQLLDVFNQSSAMLSQQGWSSILKESFWQCGCREVGIKRGSESTVGQSSTALSELSISLIPPYVPSLCFLSLCVVIKGSIYLRGGHIIAIALNLDNFIYDQVWSLCICM